jgi:transposase
MDKRPDRERFSEPEQDALIAALWAEVQLLKARLAALEAKAQEPRQDAHTSSVPPAQTPKANLRPGLRTGTRREASVGRTGGGRPLHPTPDHTRVEQDGGQGPRCGQSDVAPVPVRIAPGTPFGASIQRLATALRSPHAISDERLSALVAQVYGVAISEGALANLFPLVTIRLDHRVEEILTRCAAAG